MDKEAKALIKAERAENKTKLKELNKKAKMYSAIHPVAGTVLRPVLAGGTAQAAGYADGRFGTNDNKHWPSIAGGVVTFIGSVGAAAAGHPTAGELVSDVCAGFVSGPRYMAGYEAGQKAKSAAPAG